MATVDINARGHNEAVTVTGNKTLAANDQGMVQNFTATATVTLPAATAGASYLARVGKEGITLTVATNGTDTLQGAGLATGAASKGIIFTNQPAGSWVQLLGVSGGWSVGYVLGTVTRQP